MANENLEKLLDMACQCDAMVGHSCGAHALHRALKKELEARTMGDFGGDGKRALEVYRAKVSHAGEMKTAIKKLADEFEEQDPESSQFVTIRRKYITGAVRAMEAYLNADAEPDPLIDALEFYADGDSWKVTHAGCQPTGEAERPCNCTMSAATEDEGERAREALGIDGWSEV